MKRESESGQALLTGLILMVLMSFVTLYFGYFSESTARSVYRMTQSRIALLQNRNEIAVALNQISFNNRNMLVSLATAENAIFEAFDSASTLADLRPAWKTIPTKRAVENTRIEAAINPTALKNLSTGLNIDKDDDFQNSFSKFDNIGEICIVLYVLLMNLSIIKCFVKVYFSHY